MKFSGGFLALSHWLLWNCSEPGERLTKTERLEQTKSSSPNALVPSSSQTVSHIALAESGCEIGRYNRTVARHQPRSLQRTPVPYPSLKPRFQSLLFVSHWCGRCQHISQLPLPVGLGDHLEGSSTGRILIPNARFGPHGAAPRSVVGEAMSGAVLPVTPEGAGFRRDIPADLFVLMPGAPGPPRRLRRAVDGSRAASRWTTA